MTDKERQSYFQSLPPLHQRTEFIPAVRDGETGAQPAAEPLTPPSEAEPAAPTGDTAFAAECTERERITLAGIDTVARAFLGLPQVAAFDKRAEQVRDTLKRGDVVEVIGYRHERQVPRRDATTRAIQEIYATLITQR